MKPTDFRAWQALVQALVPFIGCAILDTFLKFPNVSFLHLGSGDSKLTSLNACIFCPLLQIIAHLAAWHMFIISQFWWVRFWESLAEFSWILCSGSHKAAKKRSSGLCSHLGAWLGIDLLPSSLGCLTQFISLLLWVWGPWLLAGSWPEATLSS